MKVSVIDKSGIVVFEHYLPEGGKLTFRHHENGWLEVKAPGLTGPTVRVRSKGWRIEIIRDVGEK